MARTAEIRDEDILEAARAVFLEKGVEATTAEVARRAGISEGSIFNRFKTKDELFRAAMSTKLDASPWMLELERRVGKGDVRDQLVEIGMQAIDFFRVVLPLGMMNWANKRVCHETPPGLEPPPMRALRRMASYFEAEMRSGRIHRHDPEVVARSFVGALVAFVFLETTWSSNTLPLPAATYVRGHVELLITGLRPETVSRPTTEPTRTRRR